MRMTAFVRRIALAAATALVLAAAPAADARVAEAEAETLAEVKDYLEGIETMRARFRQEGDAGRFATGMLFVHRPWRFRFEYDDPIPILVVSEGRNLIHYDRELKSATMIPTRRTPAWFLLAPEIDMDDRVMIRSVARYGGVIEVVAVASDEPAEGLLTLRFREDPIELFEWEVRDATGELTRVTLIDIEKDVQLLPQLFQFTPPHTFNP
jgi:outer membrane lipoprotein-sorting protein